MPEQEFYGNMTINIRTESLAEAEEKMKELARMLFGHDWIFGIQVRVESYEDALDND